MSEVSAWGGLEIEGCKHDPLELLDAERVKWPQLLDSNQTRLDSGDLLCQPKLRNDRAMSAVSFLSLQDWQDATREGCKLEANWQ